MRHTSLAELPCPIARTLDVVGEWWTLLIVRDALLGTSRFDDFKKTGIADNILAARLKMLTEEGILERRQYQARPARHEYLLTEKGMALAPVLAALRSWGRTWTTGEDHSPAWSTPPAATSLTPTPLQQLQPTLESQRADAPRTQKGSRTDVTREAGFTPAV